VDEIAWEPKTPRPGTLVSVKIRFEEGSLRQQVKNSGGRWNEKTRAWKIRYDKAVELGLRKRIVGRECI
jgi:hypothetical protein